MNLPLLPLQSTKTMTFNELRRTPMAEEERQTILTAAEKARAGKTTDDLDCPKQSKEKFAKFRLWHEVHSDWHKPTKTEIHMRVDTDILEWYKKQGKGYQTKMNAVLRASEFSISRGKCAETAVASLS